MAKSPILTCAGAAVRFDDGSEPFAPVSFSVSARDKILLSQESGYGKTTLIRMLAGLQSPTVGSVDKAHSAGSGRCTGAAVMFQEPVLFDGLDAESNIALLVPERSKPEIRQALQKVLPEESLGRAVSQLSGGQRRRVELCRALLSSFDLVLLDEPFAGLDVESTSACVKLICELACDRGVVVASHDTASLKSAGFVSLSF